MNLRLALFLLTPLLAIGCQPSEPANTPAVTAPVASLPAASPVDGGAASAGPRFEAERAYAHVKAQVDFGPRPAGSAALEKTRDYLLKELKSYGLKVRVDEFSPVTPAGRVKMKNLVAELPGQQSASIIIASHYDTKKFTNFRFVGANDGASSTGVLLELARVLALDQSPRQLTYQFVFLDGEEAFCSEWSECLNGNDNTYGSRHMAEQLKKTNQASQIRAMILLDMVGDRRLAIPREENSSQWLVEAIWSTARELGYQRHFTNETHWMADDHLPFLKAGIPAVDLIDFDYGDDNGSYWHTAADTLDKIDPRSLGIVGEVVQRSLPRIAAVGR